MRKWCASTINSTVLNNYNKFIKGKPEYTWEELLKKVPKKYHSIIDVFMKHDADVLPEHKDKNHSIQLEEGKNPPFVQKYRLLSDQENNAMIKYIQKHFGKDFIQPSLLAGAASILLVKKSNGVLHFYINYCVLNAVIIKN